MTSDFLQNVKYYVNCKISEKFFHVTLYQKSLEKLGFQTTCSLHLLHVCIKHFHFVNTSTTKIKLSTYYMVLRTLVRNSFDFNFLGSTLMYLTFTTKTLMVSQMNNTNNVNIIEVEKVVEAD